MDTVKRVDPKDIPPFTRNANKGLMIQWINRDLVNRAKCDIHTSYVFYDKDYLFANLVLTLELSELGLRQLFEHTNIRYYSKGV